MTREDLTIRRDVLGDMRLRADEIRRQTLVELARAWADDRTAVVDVLDRLASVVASPSDGEGAEVDAAVGDVEEVCGMSAAEVLLSRDDVVQLINQALTAYRPVPVVRTRHMTAGSAVAA